MKEVIKDKTLLYNTIAKGDPEAFANLYDRHVAEVYRFVFFKLSNKEEAEDITSDVFLQLWRYLQEEGRRVKNFRGLLYQIARNKIIDTYRARAKKQEVSLEVVLELPLESINSVSDRLAEQGEMERIFRAVKKMKEEYQEVIVLRYINELTIGEIADALGKKRTAVRVTLHRATKKLKELLEPSL